MSNVTKAFSLATVGALAIACGSSRSILRREATARLGRDCSLEPPAVRPRSSQLGRPASVPVSLRRGRARISERLARGTRPAERRGGGIPWPVRLASLSVLLSRP
jgi:hypothetical protein